MRSLCAPESRPTDGTSSLCCRLCLHCLVCNCLMSVTHCEVMWQEVQSVLHIDVPFWSEGLDCHLSFTDCTLPVSLNSIYLRSCPLSADKMVGCKSSDVNLNSQSMCNSCHLNVHTTVGSLLFHTVLLVVADGTFFCDAFFWICIHQILLVWSN